MTDTFVDALAGLPPGDSKRAAAFLGKMLHEPDAASLRPEIVHDAGDRAIRSYRVTHDLRAIGHVEGDSVVLLYVGRHDDAYEWAKHRCIACHPVTGEIQVVADPGAAHLRLAEKGAVGEAARILGGKASAPSLFDTCTDEYLLSIGVPPSWLPTVRMIRTEEMLLMVAPDLPPLVAERLVSVATGELVVPLCGDAPCGGSSSAEDGIATATVTHWMCTVADGAALCDVLDQAGIEHGLGSGG